MTPTLLALKRAEARLAARLAELEERLAGGEDVWREYAEAAVALAAVEPTTRPGMRGELMTTKQLAAKLQLSPRTIRRRVRSGELTPAKIGRAVRWSA